MRRVSHFTHSSLERSESFAGGESELRVFENSGSSRVVTQLIVRSGGGGLVLGPLTKNLRCSRLRSKHRVLYSKMIMEEGL